MELIGVIFNRWNTARKLRRGRCYYCRAVLRDDIAGFCSAECRESHSAELQAY